MVLVILAGIGYALWADSIPASILTAGLILYRAQRPGKFVQRVREFRYQQQAANLGED